MNDPKNGTAAESGGTLTPTTPETTAVDGGNTPDIVQDDQTPELFSSTEKAPQNGKTGENEFNLGDLFDPAKQDVVLDKLLTDDGKNAKAAVKAATQRNMAIAEERQAFERERQQWQNDMAQMRQQLGQFMSQFQTPKSPYAPPEEAGLSHYEATEELSPAMRNQMARLQGEVGQLREMLGVLNLDINTRTVDGQLSGKYGDYNAREIDDVIQRMDHATLRETVYKARKFDGINLDEMLAKAERAGAEKLLRKLQIITKKSDEVRDPLSLKSNGGGNLNKGKPETWEEARARASAYNLFD